MIEIKVEDILKAKDGDSGIFDKVILGFLALFPVKEGDALHNVIQASFETGLKIGYEAGKYFSEFEKISTDIARKNIEVMKETIEREHKLLEKRKEYEGKGLLEKEKNR